MEEFNIKLTIGDINQIIQTLAKNPYEEVAGLIHKVQAQVSIQHKANQETNPDS